MFGILEIFDIYVEVFIYFSVMILLFDYCDDKGIVVVIVDCLLG